MREGTKAAAGAATPPPATRLPAPFRALGLKARQEGGEGGWTRTRRTARLHSFRKRSIPTGRCVSDNGPLGTRLREWVAPGGGTNPASGRGSSGGKGETGEIKIFQSPGGDGGEDRRWCYRWKRWNAGGGGQALRGEKPLTSRVGRDSPGAPRRGRRRASRPFGCSSSPRRAAPTARRRP